MRDLSGFVFWAFSRDSVFLHAPYIVIYVPYTVIWCIAVLSQ